MLSKIVRPVCLSSRLLLRAGQLQPTRHAGKMFPPTQYDTPIPKRLRLGYVLRNYWEIAPLFVVTCTSMGIMIFAIIWSIMHKVDVTYRTHDHRDTISSTMSLCQPTVHKLFTITQIYEPWPEMQGALAKMCEAELALLEPCTQD